MIELRAGNRSILGYGKWCLMCSYLVYFFGGTYASLLNFISFPIPNEYQAWTLVGTCEGTITPTVRPTMDPLANVGGCPNEWEEWTNVPGQTKYEEGDLVTLNGLVYKCKSSLCSSTGFQPEEDVAGK